tara:strand:- start:299 stop:772 length:474 start_codon:yes stop_codon:yes gene_type:complete
MDLKRLLSIIASGFGSGLSPIAPGTVGSALAAIIYYFFIWESVNNFLSIVFFILFIIVSFFIGIFAYSQTAEEEDPKSFVWDEFVGMWIACIPLSLFQLELVWLIGAFILFRIFDIWKPWIIKTYDNKSGSFYVMIDDVLAGLFTALIIFTSFLFIP